MFLFHRSELNQAMRVEYILSQDFSEDQWPAAFNTYQAYGAYGYVYKSSIVTTANNGSNSSSGIFFKIGQSNVPYEYKLVADIQDTAPFLIQLNKQGAAGYRLKAYLYNGTQPFNVYVRETYRSSAKYIYRYGRCVSKQDELFVQINRNGAQGYRLIGSLSGPDFCTAYIKDTSKKSKFVYEMVPELNVIDDFLAKTNELGARGYRNPGFINTTFVSNGTISQHPVPLYYRDKTQKDCTFSYTSAPVPNSPDELLALLQKQEAKGFNIAGPFGTSTDQVLVFEKIRNCRYRSLNIDAFYWFYSFSLFLTHFYPSIR